MNTGQPSRKLHTAFGSGQIFVNMQNKWSTRENLTNRRQVPRARRLARPGCNLKELGQYGMDSSGLEQKLRKFLEHLRDLKFLKGAFACWSWSFI
jgi:hypothetical protein